MICCQLSTVHRWDDVRIYHKMCKTLAAAGYDVHLVAPATADAVAGSVTLHPLPTGGGRFSRIWKRQPLAIAAILKLKPDVIHFHDPELLPLGLLLRVFGFRVIYDVHEDVALQIMAKPWIATYFRKIIGQTFRVFERFASKQMSAVVIAWARIGNGLVGTDCTLIQNFPSLQEFSQGYANNVAQDADSIVYVGGLTEERGLRGMVQAVGLAKAKVTLKLAGNFAVSAFQSELEQELGWKQTEFLGWLDRQNIAKTISAARVGMLTLLETPNHLVALPIKMFEYFAAGKPIIASNFPYWRELSGGNCLFVNPSEPQEIADAIDWIINHPMEAQAMGKRGQAMVFEKCNWEKESEKLLALYKTFK